MNNSSTEDSMQHVVDEVRALRAEVSGETHGFERMGEYLRKVRDEYLNRTGRFAGLGREPSESVRQAIASAADEHSETFVDEVRAHRQR